MTEDDWKVDDLDLNGYLARIGVPRLAPSRKALEELHEAHSRTFTFDNIDVLLGQHPGVSLAAVQHKFVERGRGGYCFEHTTIFAAALERLGYAVERRLGRVGVQARTHALAVVTLGADRFLADPGFTLTISRPMPLRDGATANQNGWEFQLRTVRLGSATGWQLNRRNREAWEPLHTHDDLPVHPVDLVAAHHFTSTHPETHFRKRLMVSKHVDDTHVTLSHDAVTIRTAGQATKHHALDLGGVTTWLRQLDVHLTVAEEQALLARVAHLRG